ncbi:gluconate kinase, SKI family [Arthrobacter alpinus]|uniref:Gluconokinase n=1 Tax=Arthrobacter alpinus TaxID=656366 RepID=A0A1H5EJV7_9MICC|nr:gluconokinase [Arthrobacter alpinus]SED91308.1 gluconate kinase, SKI family [Arthrobacter alpinus]
MTTPNATPESAAPHSESPKSPATRVVVMGVSGAGKSTIGTLVADAMNFPFVDADSLHPLENIRKMAAGTPLNDEDRWPWLDLVGHELATTRGKGIVVACSALKRRYRDAIRAQAPDTIFLHLEGSLEVLSSRLEGRSGHFMPPNLLASQLDALEPMEADEAAVVIDIAASMNEILDAAVAGIRQVSGD